MRWWPRAKRPGGNIVSQFHDSIHGKALTGAAAGSAPTCLTAMARIRSAQSLTRRAPPTGRAFRTRAAAATRRSGRSLRQVSTARCGIEGNIAAPGCNDCHSAHRIQQHEQWRAFRTQVINECGNCHADYLSTYRDTFHGQVTALGYAAWRRALRVTVPTKYCRSNPASTVSGQNRLSDLSEVSCGGVRRISRASTPTRTGTIAPAIRCTITPRSHGRDPDRRVLRSSASTLVFWFCPNGGGKSLALEYGKARRHRLRLATGSNPGRPAVGGGQAAERWGSLNAAATTAASRRIERILHAC